MIDLTQGTKKEEASLSHLTISGLAHRCRQETDRFFNQQKGDERYCFELFRRAVVEQNDQAWNLLVEQYTFQVVAWIQRNEYFAQADEECDYFVNKTFTNFWRAFSRNPQKIEKFDSLKQLLQYLKLCAYTAVKEYVTRRMNPEETQNLTFFQEIDHAADPVKDTENQLAAERLWQYVLAATKNEAEKIIAEAYFLYDKKPQEIYATYTASFQDVTEVRRTKDNFLTRLRRDKTLLAILEGNT